MTLHAAADYGGAFLYSDDQDDLVTLGTLYDLLAAMKDHNHALDKGTPVQRVTFGTEANRPTTTPNEGWLYVSTDTHALWFADGAQWNQVFVLSDETIPVSAGGTGDATLLDHAVLLGDGTDPISWAAVGADHTVLQGHTADDPAFTDSPTLKDLTLTGNLVVDGTSDLKGDVHIEGSLTVDGGSPGVGGAVQVTGTPSGDVTTVANAYTDLDDMTIVMTTGAQLFVTLAGIFSIASHGSMNVALAIDGTAEVAVTGFADLADGTTDQWPVSTSWLFTGLTPGAHTIKARWLVDALNTGTSLADRRMIAIP